MRINVDSLQGIEFSKSCEGPDGDGCDVIGMKVTGMKSIKR